MRQHVRRGFNKHLQNISQTFSWKYDGCLSMYVFADCIGCGAGCLSACCCCGDHFVCWGLGRWYVARHQPTHLGREPRACTVGRVQMPSRASRWHAPRCANVGAWGRSSWPLRVVSPDVNRTSLGPTAKEPGKLGRPHVYRQFEE